MCRFLDWAMLTLWDYDSRAHKQISRNEAYINHTTAYFSYTLFRQTDHGSDQLIIQTTLFTERFYILLCAYPHPHKVGNEGSGSAYALNVLAMNTLNNASCSSLEVVIY